MEGRKGGIWQKGVHEHAVPQACGGVQSGAYEKPGCALSLVTRLLYSLPRRLQAPEEGVAMGTTAASKR